MATKTKTVKRQSPKTAKPKAAKPKSKPPTKKSKPAVKKTKPTPVKKPKSRQSPVRKVAKQKPVKRLPPVATKPARDSTTKELLDAADAMQDIAPGTIAEIHDAPASARSFTPWKMIVRFILPRGSSYDDLYEILVTWERDRPIGRKIGMGRLSRIQVRYIDKKGRGAHGEYTLSEISEWEVAISRAVEKVGVRDDRLDSLRERYGSESDSISYVESVIVWWSTMTAKEIKLGKKDSRKKAS